MLERYISVSGMCRFGHNFFCFCVAQLLETIYKSYPTSPEQFILDVTKLFITHTLSDSLSSLNFVSFLHINESAVPRFYAKGSGRTSKIALFFIIIVSAISKI